MQAHSARDRVPRHMAEDLSAVIADTDAPEAAILRIYEIGYHVVPTADETMVEKTVSDIRSTIEKAGGSFIAEGAPVSMKLAYPMETREGDKRVNHDRSYFGWIKFEAPIAAAHSLNESLKLNANVLRHILFQTVREETRARMKPPTLREVKRTDTIKSSPRRPEEESAPISEVDLDKALQDITTE